MRALARAGRQVWRGRGGGGYVDTDDADAAALAYRGDELVQHGRRVRLQHKRHLDLHAAITQICQYTMYSECAC